MPPPRIGKLAQIVTGLFLANYLWSSSAVAADYELNVDNPDLIECSGDDYTATHQAMVVYKDQISQKRFSISTQGYTPDTDDFIAGVFFHRTDNATVVGNTFTLDLAEGAEPIKHSFMAISAEGSNGMSVKDNVLTVVGHNSKGFAKSDSHLHFVHVNQTKATWRFEESEDGSEIGQVRVPAYGSNQAEICNNQMFVRNLIHDGDVAVVSATKVGGTVDKNYLEIKGSTIKRVSGVSGSSQAEDSGTLEGLNVVNNKIVAKNSTFSEIYGANISGGKVFGKISGNELELVDVDITKSKYDGVQVFGQYTGYATNKQIKFESVDNGILTIKGKFTVDNGSSGEIGGTMSNHASVMNSQLKFIDANVTVGGYAAKIFGGLTTVQDAEANGNSILISDSDLDVSADLFGGRSEKGSAENNFIRIEKGSNVEANSIVGAYAVGEVKNASVIIDSSTVKGKVAVFGGSSKTTSGSGSITVLGDSDLSEARLLPHNISLSIFKGLSETTLTLDGYSGSILSLGTESRGSVLAFDRVNLHQQTWERNDAILTVKEDAILKKDSFDEGSLSFVDAEAVAKGGTITLVEAENGITYTDPDVADEKKLSSTAGTAIDFDGTIRFGKNEVTYTVDKTESSSQTVLVGDSRLAAAAFVNQSTDLLDRVFQGFINTRERYGLQTFATAEGTKSDYDLSSSIKINGWNFLAGVRALSQTDFGNLTSAVFVEYGEGNYRTNNSRLGISFRTDGDLQYIGAGVAMRLMTPSLLYVEGSIRAGELKSDLRRGLMNGDGTFYDVDTTSFYGGFHVGAGFIAQPMSGLELDSYAKYFYTYTDSDSFRITDLDETYEFDSISSNRFRIGTRVNWNYSNVSFMFGLAGEYEFDAESDMIAANAPARTSDLGGFSAFVETGLSVRPSDSSPWQFDMQFRGWQGERDAISGMATVNYFF